MDATITRAVGVIERLESLASEVIAPVGVARLPAAPTLLRQPSARPFDWLVLRVEDDPLYKSGQLAMPRTERQKLRWLARQGVTFDEFLVGHEVPRELTAKLADGAAIRADDLIKPTPSRSSETAVKVLEAGFRCGRIALGAALAVPATALAALADPVLLGAVTSDGSRLPGTPAALFLLARW